MPFNLVRQDITKMKVDAIVNAANTDLKMGGGVCGAIFKAAGSAKLQAACDKLAPIKTGEALITPGFDLPAKFIIHTAGPIYTRQSKEESERLLRSAYTESLWLAVENACESIAFPLISSGIYGYPKEEALRVATNAIQDFLRTQDLDVSLVLFDKSAFSISKKLLGEVRSYIDDHYADTHVIKRRGFFDLKSAVVFEAKEVLDAGSPFNLPALIEGLPLENIVEKLDEPVSTMLLKLIDAKGMSDVEVYKRANLDRRLFSKIRSNKDYSPSKRTVLSLAVALELSLKESEALLARAGYALSHAAKSDLIVEYFIVNEKYDIFAINEVLFAYDQALLGGA